MDIKPGRMVYLGYGKYWRSDSIVGVMPIEDDRGPGRRTHIYTATLNHPIVASRTERAVLQDMALATDEVFRMQEARELMTDFLDAIDQVPDVLKRLLANEARFDLEQWSRRLRGSLTAVDAAPAAEQNELFTA